ncbi:MAG: hypothetical protein HY033_03650 [Ignavibacteriae bacterium]|nr:hypothetical protein [Ignavibacteria bacterium]MBI3363985.1 hypothetical protein [Ignavibacteriota bacterium]
MKNLRLACLTICFLFIAHYALSQERGFGAGILIGEPTGFSVKGWVSDNNAIDAGIAWSFYREASIHIHADYLWHSFNVFHTQEKIPIYYGIGGRIRTAKHGDAQLGVRVVVGVGYIFRNAPVDLFLEVAPIVDLAPSTELSGNGGIGARFWFR